jgi:hypothetical protein
MATQWTAGTTSGQVLTAATLNTIGAAWESYTPTFKTGADTKTITITYAKYARFQKTVFVQILATATQTGTLNGILSFSVPVGLAPVTGAQFRFIGTFGVLDSGTAFYAGAAVSNGTTFSGFANNSVDSMGANNPAMTIAVNDQISLSVCYEVA